MPSNFEVKNLFESPTHILTEIKLTDPYIGKNSEMSQWLYLEKSSSALIKLWLRSRDSSPAIEERYFEQGYLKYDKESATFIEKFNHAQYVLDSKKDKKLTLSFNDQIQKYLERQLPDL